MTIHARFAHVALMSALLMSSDAFAEESTEWVVAARDHGKMWDPAKREMVQGEQLLLRALIEGIDGTEDEVPADEKNAEQTIPVAILANGSVYFGDQWAGSWAEGQLAPKELGARMAACCSLPGDFFAALEGELRAAPVASPAATAALLASLRYAAELAER